MIRFQAAFCLTLAVIVAGCSREPARGTARGKITYNRKAVTGATIFFENSAQGVGVTTNLGADGSFEIKTYKGAGLPPGTYKIAVAPGRVMESADEIPLAGGKGPPKNLPPAAKVPEKYHKTETSGLSVELKEGDNPPIEIDLKD